VIVPSNTYIATLLAVSFTGAKPIMVEPNEKTYNINPNAIEAKITQKTKAIMPVHLYGQACEMDKIMLLAKKYNLYVVEDNAQSQGAIFKDKLTGSWGDINGTSFYPGKNLGAFGDAGAITTNSELLDSNARIWRNYGSEKKYYNEVQGFNSRLDEIQASFLSVKLKHLNTWTIERQKIAQHYHENLKNCDWIELPTVHPDASHVYHLFVIRTKYRYQLQQYLEQNGIGTLIHYPVPPHLQKAYIDLAHKKDDFPIAEALAEECLSLPMFVGLTNEQIEYVCNKIKSFGHEYL
jgi:dTDP-4-amino-4,6-dideoxygalactose transaminase